jgi:predicted DNA-binding protein
MFDVPLSPEAVTVLRELAAKTGVTAEEFARRAILERMEDVEDALLAAERLQSSDGQTISLEEVMARFGGRSAAE